MYYLTFAKGLKNKYMVVKAGNKSQAIATMSKYRSDILAYSEDELRFSFKEAREFKITWEEIFEKDVEFNTNTRKKFRLTRPLPDGRVQYFEFRDDELESYCKGVEPKGNFFTIQGQRFFVVKKGKESIPVFVIQEVRNIPKMIGYDPGVESGDKTITEPVKEYQPIETEIV